MAVILSDLKFYAAAVSPENDATTAIGGAIDLTKKHDFTDFTGLWQIISSAAGDTTQSVTLTYRDTAGSLLTEAKTLNGTTAVAGVASIERVLKAVKSATTTGDVALESTTAERTGTLQGLGLAADEVILDAGASAVDGFYVGMVFRATAGTGSGAIAEIIKYVGSSRTATLSRNVSAVFNATTVFRIAKGVFFDKTPSEIMSVVRLDISATANPTGGAAKDFYTKLFARHSNASASGLNLTGCSVQESADPAATMTFALETTMNGTGTNGVGNNRLVAPVSGVTAFDDALKNVPNAGVMVPLDAIGIWAKLTRAGGSNAIKTTWTPGFIGSSA